MPFEVPIARYFVKFFTYCFRLLIRGFRDFMTYSMVNHRFHHVVDRLIGILYNLNLVIVENLILLIGGSIWVFFFVLIVEPVIRGNLQINFLFILFFQITHSDIRVFLYLIIICFLSGGLF